VCARLAAHRTSSGGSWKKHERRHVRGPCDAEVRLAPACAQLRDRPELVDLPPRLSLFGPTRLTTTQLEVFAALAARRDVHLWLPHPSAALRERVAPVAAATGGRLRRRDDQTVALPRNPLLASSGRDARELQPRLARCDVEVTDHQHPLDGRPPTLLGRLQQALQDDAADDDTPRIGPPHLRADDRSVQVHACLGRPDRSRFFVRVLLGLLASDPTLEPRDVLVMCPDIGDYAPLISAAFGLEDDESGPQHPYGCPATPARPATWWSTTRPTG